MLSSGQNMSIHDRLTDPASGEEFPLGAWLAANAKARVTPEAVVHVPQACVRETKHVRITARTHVRDFRPRGAEGGVLVVINCFPAAEATP